jgi:hypothetical protein
LSFRDAEAVGVAGGGGVDRSRTRYGVHRTMNGWAARSLRNSAPRATAASSGCFMKSWLA